MDPTDLVDRYFASVKARNIDSLMALYADDATFILPDGREFSGAAAIREMQLMVFTSQSAPTPTVTAVVLGRNSAAAEIAARLPDGTVRHTANFYQFNGAGRIQRLSVYKQGW